MHFYAWYSKTSANRDGTATWTKPDGTEVEISYVSEGWDELSVEPGIKEDDLVFLGQVVKCVRLATELPLELPPKDEPYKPDLNDFVDPGDFE